MPKVNNSGKNNKEFTVKEEFEFIIIYRFKNWWVVEDKQWTDYESVTIIPLSNPIPGKPPGQIQLEYVKHPNGELYAVRTYYADTFPYQIVVNTAISQNESIKQDYEKLRRLRSVSG